MRYLKTILYGLYARHDELFSFEIDDRLVTSNYYILCLLVQYYSIHTRIFYCMQLKVRLLFKRSYYCLIISDCTYLFDR